MYEITLNPRDYGIEALVEGMGAESSIFNGDNRKQWANEVGIFVSRLNGLSARAKKLHDLLSGDESIKATPAALKTLKVQMFNINDALNASIDLSEKLESEVTPVGVCASSGTIGHSVSFGHTDAAVVVCRPVALADASATALGNRVSRPEEVARALKWIQGVGEIQGALVIVRDQLGVWGELDLVRLH